MKLFDYDDSSVESIYEYAKKLEGMTFNEIVQEYEKSSKKEYTSSESYAHSVSNMTLQEEPVQYEIKIAKNKNSKGQLGNLIEKYYFGYNPNGRQDADFSKTGLELKQTPIDLTKYGQYKAGERLSITNISYKEPVEDNFYKSHVWAKIKCILLIHYLRDKSKERLDYIIKFVNLFSPPQEDLDIIIEDYQHINDMIKAGRAHEISESDTMYLGACTKGANAKSSLRPQYYGDHTLARKRNYCFKISYMNYVLQNYILKNDVPCESIKKGKINASFQKYVIDLINSYIGKTDKELCHLFDRPYNNNKSQWIDLSFRMLGIKGNHAAEFEKANIVVKTIRVEENGKNRENMSFSPFKFKELIEEEWEESRVYNYFEATQFLFVVFQKEKDVYFLKKAMLWHMPYYDLNVIVRNEWLDYQRIIVDGVKLTKVKKANGEFVIKNNLPGYADTKIIHMRPHSKKSAYKLNDGFEKGNIHQDGDELPNGEWMTKQSFWLNREYVLEQLKLDE